MSHHLGIHIEPALFLREEAHRKWDLVISAPWIGEDKLEALREFVRLAKPILGDEQLLNLSHIAPLDRGNPGLTQVLQTVHSINEITEFRNEEWFEMDIERAYIFHANAEAALEPVAA
ncbi:MAG: hypothetical protein KDE19_24845 [Caldilineaceae bacterium]|nr:hypothetical protein [Caldilineaceae bacterium]